MKTESLPPPFPSGWYCVGLSASLKPGAVLKRRFMGQDAVLFRTKSGVPCLMDAYCPHLGAHLGCGGVVVEESIRCPFHHFRFDAEGKCVATGYGTDPPPKAVAGTWPVEDVNGLLMAYHALEGEAPQWRVPPLDMAGWTPLVSRVWSFRGHPQETSENSVDVGHFTCVHGYHDVRTIKPAETQGPYLGATYGMSRPAKLLGIPLGMVQTEFDVHVHGFGYSLVEVKLPKLGIRTRQFVLSCPTDKERIEFRIGLSVHRSAGPLAPLLARMAFREFVHDVHQDFPMWENKRYIAPPVLARGDGPVGVFRQWAKQFYPSGAAPAEAHA